MLCWFCSKVKGRRSCPARAGEVICSRCCGSKRQIEIRCPQECPYLHGEHDPRWESSTRHTEDARFLAHFGGVRREEIPLLFFVHQLLLRARQSLSIDLTDVETLDVVSTLARTYETLSKGVLYEHRSESPRLQAVVQGVGRVLGQRHQISGAPRASDAEVLGILQRIVSAVREHREQGSGRNYLDAAERFFRASLAEAPSIELVGEEGTAGGLIIEP